MANVIIAFDLDDAEDGDSFFEAQRKLIYVLEHSPLVSGECIAWWICHDDREDRSDRDSAVFVTKGNEAQAQAVLRAAGLAN